MVHLFQLDRRHPSRTTAGHNESLGWNCRGVGNKPTVRELVDLVKANRASIVFLCETRQKSEKVRKLRSRLGLKGFVGQDSDGLSGVLALFWDENLMVDVQELTK
jgi:hypothetical protein